MAVTRINNKDFASASFKQSQVEFTDASGAKFVTVIGSDATREMLMNKVNAFNEQNPTSQIKYADRLSGIYAAPDAGRRQQGFELW